MKATVTLELVPALVTAFTAAVPSGVLVSNGYLNTDDPSDFVLVGVDDPFSDGPSRSIDASQEFLYTGATGRKETGSINCVAFVSSGDADVSALQERMRDVLDPVATSLRSNPGESSPYPNELSWCHLSVTAVSSDLDNKGAWMLVNFVVLFEAQL